MMQCSKCGKTQVRQLVRRGIFDRVLQTVRLRKYECWSCGHQFRGLTQTAQTGSTDDLLSLAHALNSAAAEVARERSNTAVS